MNGKKSWKKYVSNEKLYLDDTATDSISLMLVLEVEQDVTLGIIRYRWWLEGLVTSFPDS